MVVLLAYFPHCGSFVNIFIILSTLWIISHNALHILEDITVFQAFLPQFFYLYNLYYPRLLIIWDISSTFLIWAYRFTGTSTNPSTIWQNSSASMLAALAQYSISVSIIAWNYINRTSRQPYFFSIFGSGLTLFKSCRNFFVRLGESPLIERGG